MLKKIMRRNGGGRRALGLLGAGTALGVVAAVGVDAPAFAATRAGAARTGVGGVIAATVATSGPANGAPERTGATAVVGDGRPTMVKAVAGNAGIDVEWTGGGADSYEAYAVLGAGDPPGSDTCAGTAGCRITGLANGTGYYVYVVGIVGGTRSEAVAANGGGVVTPAGMPTAPGTPENVGADPIDHGLEAWWQEPANVGSGVWGYTATAFDDLGGGEPGDPHGSCEVPAGEHHCSIQGLTPYTVYVVEVVAHGTGDSAPGLSDPTPAGGTAPGAPRSVKVLPGVSSLVVSWQPPASAGSGIDSYLAVAIVGGVPTATRLKARAADDPNGACDADGDETRCAIKDLSPDHSYTVGVVAVGPVGELSDEALADGTYKPVRDIVLPKLAEFPAALPAPLTPRGPGGMTEITQGGFAPYAKISLTLFSKAMYLDPVWANDQGAFTAQVKVPNDNLTHRLVASGVDPTGKPLDVGWLFAAAPGDPGLPVTGSPVTNLVRGGLALLLCGALLIVVSRRPARAN